MHPSDPSVCSCTQPTFPVPQPAYGEAVVERAEVKREVFQVLDAAAPAEAILATNTSSISITDRITMDPRPVV